MDERIEFEYRRRGVLCLIANFDVATGKVIQPTIGPTCRRWRCLRISSGCSV